MPQQIDLNLLLVALSLLLIATALFVLVTAKDKKATANTDKVVPKGNDTTVRQITLEELSRLWEREEKKELRRIELNALSTLWCDEPAKDFFECNLQLQDKRAILFLEKLKSWEWFGKYNVHGKVCSSLLDLLDKEGGSPSVVNVQGDIEGYWDENTFNILGQTNLLHHTLNVAEQIIDELSDKNSKHIIPDALVAALGHDIGKLEANRGYLYSLGEHPLAAGRILESTPGFNELKKKDDILKAIRLHHKQPDDLLGKTLKLADQKARQKELAEYSSGKFIPHETPPQQEEHSEPDLPNVPGNNLSIESEEGSRIETAPGAFKQAHTDIFETEESVSSPTKEKEAVETADISSWFNADDFLNNLKPAINKMSGRNFVAFSMPDGYVYFQTKLLETTAREMAENAGSTELATLKKNSDDMRGVLLAIVDAFKVKGCIADEYVKPGYFGSYFDVMRGGRLLKGYYTPFHAETFGSIAEMEAAKPKMLKNITSVQLSGGSNG